MNLCDDMEVLLIYRASYAVHDEESGSRQVRPDQASLLKPAN